MIVCLRTVRVPPDHREAYLAWIAEGRAVRQAHGILAELVLEPATVDGDTVVVTIWPSHQVFDAWIATPERDALTASMVHEAVDYQPITRYDVDIPFRPFPISWQDTGTAVFSFAAISLVLLARLHRDQAGRRTPQDRRDRHARSNRHGHLHLVDHPASSPGGCQPGSIPTEKRSWSADSSSMQASAGGGSTRSLRSP